MLQLPPSMKPSVSVAPSGQPVVSRVSLSVMQSRQAFTLIELLVVLAIITILGLMAVPGTARAISRGATNQAAEDLLRVAHHAHQFAKRQSATGPLAAMPHWGVALIADNGQHHATVIYGSAPTDEWLVGGQPGFRITLPSHLEIQVDQGSGLQALTGSVAWFCQYGTGWPIAAPGDQRPISVGTPAQAEIVQESSGSVGGSGIWHAFTQYVPAIPASPVCIGLTVGAHRSPYKVAVSIYDTGLTTLQPWEP